MAILIRQELYKLFKRKKTLVVIVGFILLTVFLCYGIKQNAYYMEQYSKPEFQIQNLEDNIAYLEKDMENIPDEIKNDADEAKLYQDRIQNDIKMMEEELKMLKTRVDENLSWKEILEQDISEYEKIIEENKVIYSSGDLASAKLELEQLEYLQDKEIKPQENYDFNAFIYINELVLQLGQVFLAIGIAVFAADMVSGEWTPPTMKLLLAQPVSRRKVLLSKFFAVSIAAVGLIILIEFLSFILVGSLFGFGDANYPTAIGKAFDWDLSVLLEDGTHPLELIDGSWKIVPIWQYTLMLFGYQGLFILTVTSFVFMISSIVKSSMVSMGASVVSLIATTIVFQISSFYGLSKLVFTTYSSIGEIITGDISAYLSDPNLTAVTGILILVGWIVLCYILSHILFTKRDLLI